MVPGTSPFPVKFRRKSSLTLYGARETRTGRNRTRRPLAMRRVRVNNTRCNAVRFSVLSNAPRRPIAFKYVRVCTLNRIMPAQQWQTQHRGGATGALGVPVTRIRRARVWAIRRCDNTWFMFYETRCKIGVFEWARHVLRETAVHPYEISCYYRYVLLLFLFLYAQCARKEIASARKVASLPRYAIPQEEEEDREENILLYYILLSSSSSDRLISNKNFYFFIFFQFSQLFISPLPPRRLSCGLCSSCGHPRPIRCTIRAHSRTPTEYVHVHAYLCLMPCVADDKRNECKNWDGPTTILNVRVERCIYKHHNGTGPVHTHTVCRQTSV